jgi:hypothetical protein
MVPSKATDPMSSFALGTPMTMSTAAATQIHSAHAVSDPSVADRIWVLTQLQKSDVYLNYFDMATDTWGLATSELAVSVAPFFPLAPDVSCAVRTNGNVVIAYNAAPSTSTGADRVFYRERTGTNTYSTALRVDNAGTTEWTNPVAIRGALDRVHIFFNEEDNDRLYQRTLSASNVLQSFPAAVDTSADAFNIRHIIGPGVSYVDGAATKVAVPYADTTSPTSPKTSIATLDSADVPTVSTEAVGDNILASQNSQRLHTLSVDGTTLHLLYCDGNAFELYHSSKPSGGAWSADVMELAGEPDVRGITSNVYTRGGTKYLAMVLYLGNVSPTTVQYAEINLATPQTIDMQGSATGSSSTAAALSVESPTQLMNVAAMADAQAYALLGANTETYALLGVESETLTPLGVEISWLPLGARSTSP